MMKPVLDFDARLSAVLTEDHVFVWASAGTGKTHTLTLRAMALLLRFGGGELFHGDRDVRLAAARRSARSLVMTTFTRKAAAEMSTRLFRYLERVGRAADLEELEAGSDKLFASVVASLLADVPGEDYQKLRSAAAALNEVASQFQIQTLHSFAVSLLSRHPVEAGLPSNCRFADEDGDDLSDFTERLVQRWWHVQASESSEIQSDMESVADRIPFKTIHEWLAVLVDHPWISEELPEASMPEDDVAAAAHHALLVLSSALSRTRGSRLLRLGSELTAILGAGQGVDWPALGAFLSRHEDALFTGRGVTLSHAVEGMPPEVREWLDDFPRLYDVVLNAALASDALVEPWSAWRRIVRRFVVWARDAGARELGIIEFDDIIRRACELLTSSEEVRDYEHSRLKALLVDEFQDTDPAQLNLLRLLLNPVEGASHEVLGYFVGDPKQSIYRFRGADIESVAAFRSEYAASIARRRPVRDFHLQTSFRSVRPILDFANRFFSSVLPLVKDTARLLPNREELAEPPRWIVLSPVTPVAVREGRQQAAAAVVAVIREYLEGRVEGEVRSFRDVLLLTRTNAELDQLLPVLHEAGIPVIATGAKTFYRNHEVLDFLNLLIALHHPADSLATAAVLRSPLILLSDPEIDRLLTESGTAPVIHGTDALPTWLGGYARSRLGSLRELASTRARKYLPDWISEVLEFVPGFAYQDPSDLEGRAQARIEKLARTFCEDSLRGEISPLVWLIRQRDRASRAERHDADLGEDVALADETVDAVRAMTVHKAKGLEGEFVILLDWSSLLARCEEAGSTKESIFDLNAGANQRIRGFALEWGPFQIRNRQYLEALQLDREQSTAEALRLAYVAATRARSRLTLLEVRGPKYKPIQSVEDFREAGFDPPCLRTEVWDSIPGLPALARPSRRVVDREAYRSIWDRRFQEHSEVRRLQHPSDEEGGGEDSTRADRLHPAALAARETARDTGILVHRYLEHWISLSRLEDNVLNAIAQQAGIVSDDAIRRSGQILRSFFDGLTLDSSGRPMAQRIREARILARELPVFLAMEETPWHGILDLVIEENGIVTGIDFKTGSPGKQPNAAYETQLKVYLEALRRIQPDRECRYELWWLGNGTAEDPPSEVKVTSLRGTQTRLPF